MIPATVGQRGREKGHLNTCFFSKLIRKNMIQVSYSGSGCQSFLPVHENNEKKPDCRNITRIKIHNSVGTTPDITQHRGLCATEDIS